MKFGWLAPRPTKAGRGFRVVLDKRMRERAREFASSIDQSNLAFIAALQPHKSLIIPGGTNAGAKSFQLRRASPSSAPPEPPFLTGFEPGNAHREVPVHERMIALPMYRVFRLNADKKNVQPSLIEAKTDEDAIRTAKSQISSDDVEIWQASRRVAVIKAPYVIRYN